jgi:hypothetical protein
VLVRRRSLAAALLLTLMALVAPVVALADSTSNSQFVSYTNSARSQHGLRAYVVSSDLTSIANKWAAHMAANRTLEHNPYATSEVCCWRAMGENVGVGSTVSQIQQAFMASSPHRANILSTTFTQVGIGTARGSDGQLYVDELFRLPTGATTPHYSAPTQTRPVTTHVSRSTQRVPLAVVHLSSLHPSTLHPSTWHHAALTPRLTEMFLRQVRDRLSARVRFDPVGGAFGYVQVMTALLRASHPHHR